jgi:hypothetical protein
MPSPDWDGIHLSGFSGRGSIAMVRVSRTICQFVRHEPRLRTMMFKAGFALQPDLHSAHPLAVTIPIFCLRRVPAG